MILKLLMPSMFIFWLPIHSLISGKNNGKGYYIYEKGSKPKPDPSVLPVIEESRRLTSIMPGGKVHLLHINTCIPFKCNCTILLQVVTGPNSDDVHLFIPCVKVN